MKHITKVFELYRLDWRRIFKNPIGTLLILAMIIIPSLYAWFNIAALWDPYGNTGDLKIAVYSGDKSATFNDQTINIGDKLIESLHENKQLGWTFVDSKEEIDRGVKNGKYYAGIYIPENFSKNILSFIKGDIQKPTIEYSVNEKINAIAPKITDKGAGSLQEQITKQFLETVSSTVVTQMNELGVDLDNNLPSIRKISSMVLDLNQNLTQIDGYTQQVLDLQTKMPELKEKLGKANEFIDFLPEVNRMADKVVSINGLMPQVDDAGKLVLDLQANIPQIQNAGKQIAEIDSDFDHIVATLESGVAEAKQALGVIQDVKKVLPDVQQFGQEAENLVDTAQNQLIPNLEAALPSIESAINAGLSTVISVSQTISDVVTNLQGFIGDHELSPTDKETLKTTLQGLSNQLDVASSLAGSLADNLIKLQEATNSNRFDDAIQKLQAFQNVSQQLKQQVDNLIPQIDTLSPAELNERLQSIINTANQLGTLANQIQNAGIAEQVHAVITQLKDALSSAKNVLSQTNGVIIPKIEPLLDSVSTTITTAITYLEKYQAQIPALKEEIHTANLLLNNNMNLIVGGINQAADFYQNDFPSLKTKLTKATTFIQNDLPGVEKQLTDTLTMVNEKLPDVETAIDKASEMIKNDYPSIRNGIENAAAFINKQSENVDLSDLIRILKSDANKESNFLSEPVEIKQESYYPIPNYGSASAPFYTALCLWVGGLLFSNIASTEFYLTERDKLKYSKRHQYSARMLSFLTVGFFQALVVALGNIFLLKTYNAQPVLFVLFTIFVGLIFMTILYILAAVFGNLGKGIGIILLVLSISGGGGNFPIQLSGKFFQFINPLLPFTYAVNLLREPVGGIYWPNVFFTMSVLLGFGILFGIFGIIFQPEISARLKKIHDKVSETHFFH